MTTAVLLIILAIAVSFLMVIGGALFVIGALMKKRPLRLAGTILFGLSLFGLASCFAYASVKVYRKAKGFSAKHYWHAIVDMASDDTAIRPTDPAKAKTILSQMLGKPAVLNGVDVQGVWVEGAVLSYGYFLYQADEQELLSAVASAPVDSSFAVGSDAACRAITWAECKASQMYDKGPQRNLPGWTPESATEVRCYSCLRSPWSHTILFDGKTGKVYHSISEIRD